jgi:hypothetical protein
VLPDGMHGETTGRDRASAGRPFAGRALGTRSHFPPCRGRGRSLARRPGLPDEFACADQKIVDPMVGEAGKAVHNARCAVTVLHPEPETSPGSVMSAIAATRYTEVPKGSGRRAP